MQKPSFEGILCHLKPAFWTILTERIRASWWCSGSLILASLSYPRQSYPQAPRQSLSPQAVSGDPSPNQSTIIIGKGRVGHAPPIVIPAEAGIQMPSFTGRRFFFKGNLDSVNEMLNADDQTFEQAVKDRIRIGKPDSGYILSSACSVSPYVKPDRLKRLTELARELSKYY